MNAFTISFDISAICVCIVCLVMTLLRHQTGKLQNKVFLGLLAIVALGAVGDTLYTLASPITPETLDAGHFAKSTYYFFHAALAPTCFYYMLCVAGRIRRYPPAMHAAFLAPLAICELLILSNPLTGWTFTFDAACVYHRGWVVYVMYGLGLLYLGSGVGVVIRTWNALTRVRRNSLLFYVGLVIAGVVTQMLVPALRVEIFAESLAMVGMLLTIESEDERIDMETGVYARQALLLDFERYIAAGAPFNVLCVQLANIGYISRMMGQSAFHILIQQVAAWLKERVPWFQIYRTSLTSFVLVSFDSDKTETDSWVKAIQERSKSPWEALDMEVYVAPLIMHATIPSDFASGEEILMLADTQAPLVPKDKVLSGEDFDYLKRRSLVEHAIGRGLEEGNFEVYYQPICTSEGAVCAAEALMRLHDPEAGDIPPDEFINVAEHNGAIDRIGMFALTETCSFIASGIPHELGVETVHVNLSVVQCLDPDFADDVSNTVQKYGVSPAQLSFEITESVAASDEGMLHDMMDTLIARGFRFSMDDYGTGYSSIHSVLAFDFDVVKVDKEVLWDADQGGSGETVLEYTMKMISETGRKTLAEGVETQSQIDLLRRIGTDYFQGYYYAAPLPKDQFIARVEELNGKNV